MNFISDLVYRLRRAMCSKRLPSSNVFSLEKLWHISCLSIIRRYDLDIWPFDRVKPGFHYPSWRPELTSRVDGWQVSITVSHAFPLATRQLVPSTRVVETGNRTLVLTQYVSWYRNCCHWSAMVTPSCRRLLLVAFPIFVVLHLLIRRQRSHAKPNVKHFWILFFVYLWYANFFGDFSLPQWENSKHLMFVFSLY